MAFSGWGPRLMAFFRPRLQGWGGLAWGPLRNAFPHDGAAAIRRATREGR